MKMPYLAKYKDCTGCGSCVSSCPKNAIVFRYDSNGHLKPSVDLKNCVRCGNCERNCPVLNNEKLKRHNPKEIKNYTVWAYDDSLCKNSTSGGAFAQIAKDFILEKNGYIYGAELSVHNSCEHVEISNVADIYRVVGTKYIQSDTSRIYNLIRQRLEESKPCLFSGTPCQIAGLLMRLQNTPKENLYTIELICHGVPSKYITDLACKYYNAEHITSYRSKDKGWYKGYICKYATKNNDIIYAKENEFFYRRFGIAERLSCYTCKYATIERLADLTIGDQWGLMHKYPQRKELGASLVVCSSLKGQELLKSANLYVAEEKNNTLNAPTLFMPRKVFHISKWIWLIKKLPLKYQYAISTLDRKLSICVIPLLLLYRIEEKLFNYRFARKISFIKSNILG